MKQHCSLSPETCVSDGLFACWGLIVELDVCECHWLGPSGLPLVPGVDGERDDTHSRENDEQNDSRAPAHADITVGAAATTGRCRDGDAQRPQRRICAAIDHRLDVAAHNAKARVPASKASTNQCKQ